MSSPFQLLLLDAPWIIGLFNDYNTFTAYAVKKPNRSFLVIFVNLSLKAVR